jgi:hypothetical protein
MNSLAGPALPDSGFIFARIVFFGMSDSEESTFFEAALFFVIISTSLLLYPFHGIELTQIHLGQIYLSVYLDHALF